MKLVRKKFLRGFVYNVEKTIYSHFDEVPCQTLMESRLGHIEKSSNSGNRQKINNQVSAPERFYFVTKTSR